MPFMRVPFFHRLPAVRCLSPEGDQGYIFLQDTHPAGCLDRGQAAEPGSFKTRWRQ